MWSQLPSANSLVLLNPTSIWGFWVLYGRVLELGDCSARFPPLLFVFVVESRFPLPYFAFYPTHFHFLFRTISNTQLRLQRELQLILKYFYVNRNKNQAEYCGRYLYLFRFVIPIPTIHKVSSRHFNLTKITRTI